MNTFTGKILGGNEFHKRREVASLTKIMTCLLCLRLCEKYKLDINTLIFKVS